MAQLLINSGADINAGVMDSIVKSGESTDLLEAAVQQLASRGLLDEMFQSVSAKCSTEQLRVFVRHGVSWPVLDEAVPDWQQRLYVPLSSGTFHLLPSTVQRQATHTVLALEAGGLVPRDIQAEIAAYVAGLPWRNDQESKRESKRKSRRR